MYALNMSPQRESLTQEFLFCFIILFYTWNIFWFYAAFSGIEHSKDFKV